MARRSGGRKPPHGKRPQPGPPRGKPGSRVERRPDELLLRKIGRVEFAFFPPNLAIERAEDIEEVHVMRDGGETEIARDELLYLVSDCRQFLEAHNLLGELALEEGDIKLARGHFGFAYEVATEIIPVGFRGRIPADREYNPEFYTAGRGLARCLIALGKPREGRDVLEWLAQLDPEEPNVKAMLEEMKGK